MEDRLRAQTKHDVLHINSGKFSFTFPESVRMYREGCTVNSLLLRSSFNICCWSWKRHTKIPRLVSLFIWPNTAYLVVWPVSRRQTADT